MNASRLLLPTVCAIATLVIFIGGPTFFKTPQAKPPAEPLRGQAGEVNALTQQLQGAADDLQQHVTALAAGLPGPRRDSTLQSALEIHDTLIQLAERQRVFQEQVQALAAQKEKSAGKDPIEMAAGVVGLFSTVLTMWLGWRTDRRDNQRLQNEIRELRSKLAGAH